MIILITSRRGPIELEVLVKGGLGNQLFQLANAINISYHQGVAFRLRYQASGRDFALGDFGLRINESYRVAKDSDCLILEKVPRKSRLILKKYSESTFSYAEIPIFTKSSKIEGYFQSHRYFENIDSIFINYLREFLPPVDLIKHDIALHIRRGDYANNATFKSYHGLIGEAYYKSAIEKTGVADPNVLVFTDDIKSTTIEFQEFFSKYRVQILQNDNPIVDLGMMANSKNLAIANSTFGWWAGKLSRGNVIAPREWFASGPKDFKLSDLIPPEWILE